MSESDPNQGEVTIAFSAPPYLECIQWVPRRFAGGISPVTIVDLVFEQRVFAQIAKHGAAFPETSVFGALIGRLFEDPTCERRWARVERIIRSPSTIPESADASRLGQTLRATEMEWVPEDGEVLLGWYRTHLENGLYLTPEEARFHEGGFAQPWSVALVLTGAEERRAGGVFQRTDPEGLSRSVYTPFYELVDPSSEFNGTTKRSFVVWANYQTETRIVRAGRGSVSAALPERSRGARAESKRSADRADVAPKTDVASEASAAPKPSATPQPGTAPQAAAPGTSSTPAKTGAGGKPDARGKTRPPTEARTSGPTGVSAGRGASRARTKAPNPPSVASRTTGPVGLPKTSRESSPAPRTGPSGGPVGPIEPAHTRGSTAHRRESTAGRAPQPPRGTREKAREEPPVDSEAEWEKKQIQRSLMAVGRSLSPSDLGTLGLPADGREKGRDDETGRPSGADDTKPAEAVRVGRGRESAAPAGATRSTAGGSVAPDARSGPTVIPIHRDLHRSSGLVGRSRRRHGLPAAKILAAAAGLTLVATAGLVGARTMMRDGASADGPTGAVTDGSSVAGLTLSPRELGRPDDDPEPATGGIGSGPVSTEAGAAAQDQWAAPDPTSGDASGPAETAGTPGATGAEAAGVVRPPSLEGLEVEDPRVAVFENALAIFRQEAERYEGVRLRFDDGDETCNPLNLSFRGIRDAFQRLDRLTTEAGERVSPADLRAFESAERQFAMSRTHYELTDCPMPVGG